MVDIGVDLGLTAEVGGLRHDLQRRERREEERRKALTPQTVRFKASGTSPSTGDLALTFPGPDTGFYWMVRRLIVGGAAWTTAVNGTAEVYVTALGGSASSTSTYTTIRDLADLVDQSVSLPNKAYYGNYEFPVQPGENVVVVVHSPSASTGYVASLQATVIRTAALPEILSI